MSAGQERGRGGERRRDELQRGECGVQKEEQGGGTGEVEEEEEEGEINTAIERKRRRRKRSQGEVCNKEDEELQREKRCFRASLCRRLELELAPEGNRVVG